MARKIQSRITLTGILKAESPIHVGGINNNPIVDLSLALNGQGQYYIPGTSLAGAFRGWLEANSGNQIQSQDIKNLFGHQDKDNGHASFLLIEDAVIKNSKDFKQEIRDGVGIDRYTGTAADKTKFDRAILPTGTEINLNLTLEVDSNDSESISKTLLVTLIKALQESKIRLGAAKTRGLGKVRLQENLSIKERCFQNRENLLASLRGEGNAIALDQISTASLDTETPQLDLTIHWQPQGALMVKSAADGIAVDILPLVSAKNGKTTFVIPGSSIKGALRSQAERIMRTVLSTHQIVDRFNDQVEVPIVTEIFGKSPKKDEKGNIGLLYIEDCYAKLSMPADEWEKVRASTNELELRQTLDYLATLDAINARLRNTQQAFHVAIDRWTGGAADSFLYSNLEPMSVDWEPIQISLKLPQKGELELKSYLALLFLLIRDLQSDRIPLGYGVNRGMGAIQLTNIELKSSGIGNLLPTDLKFPTELKGGNIADLKEVLPILTKAWQDKIQSLQEVKS
jgi:CRISPR/Cas system CSM-associated protein Csm3 (group 7 of RAMP superfamily)